MINTVFFDLNGVLFDNDTNFEMPKEVERLFKRISLTSDDRGVMELVKAEMGWTEEELWKQVDVSWSSVIVNNVLVNFIAELKKQGYKTGIISNTSGLVIRRNATRLFGEHNVNDLFNELIISSEVGTIKPLPAIFQIALDRVGSKAVESIFIDDYPVYLDGAKLLGMNTIVHENNEKTMAEILKMLAR